MWVGLDLLGGFEFGMGSDCLSISDSGPEDSLIYDDIVWAESRGPGTTNLTSWRSI